jgi:hypothetical protein
MKVQNVTTFKNCTIRLWVTIKNETQLIDNISIEPLNLVKTTVTEEHLFMQASSTEKTPFTRKVERSPKFEFSSFKPTMTSPMLSTRYKRNITTNTKDDSTFSTFETTGTSTDLTTSFQEPDEPKDIFTSNWILIFLFGLIATIVILMLLSIIYHYYKSRKNAEQERNVPEEIILLDVATSNGQTNNTNIKLEDFETYVRNLRSTTKNLENQFRVSRIN